MRRAIAILMITAMLLGVLGSAVQAQPSAAITTITLSANGWSVAGIGGWNSDTKTATLTTDLQNQGIVIAADDIVLDGGGHTLTGSKGLSSRGVFAGQRATVTIKNLTIKGFDYGIYLVNCTNATLTGNVMAGNGYNFRVDGTNEFQYRHNIDTTNKVQDKPILYLTDAKDSTYDVSRINAGTVYLIKCSGITLTGLALSGNHVGVLLWGTSNSRLENLQVTNNERGIWLRGGSNGNTLAGNTVDGSKSYGIYVQGSSGNALTTNTIRKTSSNGYGLYISGADNNRAYRNKFEDNVTQAYVESGSGNVFFLPAPTGGNYWSNFAGNDSDGDGFVDAPPSPYKFQGGQDNLPLSGVQKADKTPPVTTAVFAGKPGAGGWYRSEVNVTLAAIDNDGGSGVASTEYSLNGGVWQPYGGQFTIGKNEDGITKLAFRSTDNAGNVELAKPPLDIRIDKTAPEVTITKPAPGELLPSGMALSFGARDAVSGLAGVKGSLFDGLSNSWTTLTEKQLDALKEKWDGTGTAPVKAGVYDLKVEANDVAGNTGAQTNTFIVPSAEGTKVTGGGWFGTSGGKGAQGKAFINVVCQSRKAPAAPTGQFSFRADALGNLGEVNLKGTSYRWLVVRDGLAWLEGTGTFNGADNYRFQVVVQGRKTASEPDRVRVMIWDQKGNSVYDTQQGNATAAPTGTLSDGGNIAVHKG